MEAIKGKEIISIGTIEELDCDPDLSYLQQEYKECDAKDAEVYRKQDAARLADYEHEHWHMIGIYAKAEIRIKGVSQIIRTGGLWGIESDSDQSYKDEVAKEEENELIHMLLELGFYEKEIDEQL